MSNIINCRGKIYYFPRLEYETNKSYNIRRKYIIENKPETNTEFNNAIKNSIMLVYTIFLKCRYD